MFNNKDNNNKRNNGTGTNSKQTVSNQKYTSNRSTPAASVSNMISEKSEIIGTLKSRRDILIAGKVDGGVEAEGTVTVASTGFIEGTINAKEARIAGRVNGDIHTSEKLMLEESAVIESDVYTPNFVIKEGASFNGACHMEQDPDESSEALFDNIDDEANGEIPDFSAESNGIPSDSEDEKETASV